MILASWHKPKPASQVSPCEYIARLVHRPGRTPTIVSVRDLHLPASWEGPSDNLCASFQMNSLQVLMRNESLLWALLVMNPLPQRRNSHCNWTLHHACHTIPRRAIAATAGRRKEDWSALLKIKRKGGMVVSPAGSPTHAVQMQSAIDCPHQKGQVPTPSGHQSRCTGLARIFAPSFELVEFQL